MLEGDERHIVERHRTGFNHDMQVFKSSKRCVCFPHQREIAPVIAGAQRAIAEFGKRNLRIRFVAALARRKYRIHIRSARHGKVIEKILRITAGYRHIGTHVGGGIHCRIRDPQRSLIGHRLHHGVHLIVDNDFIRNLLHGDERHIVERHRTGFDHDMQVFKRGKRRVCFPHQRETAPVIAGAQHALAEFGKRNLRIRFVAALARRKYRVHIRSARHGKVIEQILCIAAGYRRLGTHVGRGIHR